MCCQGKKARISVLITGVRLHAATHHDAKAQLALSIFDQIQTHIVPAHGSAVVAGACDGDFEFARQKRKLWVQRAPLANDFSKRTWVGYLVRRNARQFVGGDVANAIATGLNAVHVHGGQQVHHIGAFVQRYPVELHILPRAEMPMPNWQMRGAQARLGANRFVKHRMAGLVVFAGDACQHAQLRA